MITNIESLDNFFEFSKKWVAQVEDSRNCLQDSRSDIRTSVLKSWSRDRYSALILDIISGPADPLIPRQIVERWTIQYMQDNARDYITLSSTLDKRLSVLTRTVYCVTRLLPLYNCSKKTRLNIQSLIYSEAEPPQQQHMLPPIRPELRAYYPLPRY